jgi:hypothetical protein
VAGGSGHGKEGREVMKRDGRGGAEVKNVKCAVGIFIHFIGSGYNCYDDEGPRSSFFG